MWIVQSSETDEIRRIGIFLYAGSTAAAAYGTHFCMAEIRDYTTCHIWTENAFLKSFI
jgi:hypothetical protein